jgi:hypothetical protein
VSGDRLHDPLDLGELGGDLDCHGGQGVGVAGGPGLPLRLPEPSAGIGDLLEVGEVALGLLDQRLEGADCVLPVRLEAALEPLPLPGLGINVPAG